MKRENIAKLKIILLYLAIIIFVAFALGLYFHMFHGELSDDSYIWANFGNYINGLLTPFLTIVNIIVFIKLTMAIDNMEEQRSAKAIETEKQLLLMQLRKQEIDTLVEHLYKIDNYDPLKNGIDSLRHVVVYLHAFKDTGLKYFELKNKAHVELLVNSLWLDIQQYMEMVKENKEYDAKLYYSIYDSRAELIKVLVEATYTR